MGKVKTLFQSLRSLLRTVQAPLTLVAVVTAIAAVVQAWVAWRQAEIAERQLALLEFQSKPNIRLYFQPPTTLRANDPVEFRFRIANFGGSAGYYRLRFTNSNGFLFETNEISNPTENPKVDGFVAASQSTEVPIKVRLNTGRAALSSPELRVYIEASTEAERKNGLSTLQAVPHAYCYRFEPTQQEAKLLDRCL